MEIMGTVPDASPESQINLLTGLLRLARRLHHLLRVSCRPTSPLATTYANNDNSVAGQVFVVVAAGSVIAFIIRDIGDAPLAGWIIQVRVGPIRCLAIAAKC